MKTKCKFIYFLHSEKEQYMKRFFAAGRAGILWGKVSEAFQGDGKSICAVELELRIYSHSSTDVLKW
ncbi:hypothetical protein CHCC20331_1886 [Bacillus paralicheniformis]|nr:hypothetical protein CHCC20348_0987 [Bacillus paralicheniformis]TWK84467.1 hypothetical protein CHCC20331_1886 [Bacillus paralicheniformis]